VISMTLERAAVKPVLVVPTAFVSVYLPVVTPFRAIKST
jgi:hypothetical protein